MVGFENVNGARPLGVLGPCNVDDFGSFLLSFLLLIMCLAAFYLPLYTRTHTHTYIGFKNPYSLLQNMDAYISYDRLRHFIVESGGLVLFWPLSGG